MATFSRTQAFGHHLGSEGRLFITVTDADLHLEGVEGEEVQVQATFDIRATTEAEADAIFEAAQLRVTRGSGSLQLEQPDEHRGFRGLRHELETAVSRIFGGNAVEVTIQVEVPRAADVRVETVSGDVDVSGLVAEGRYRRCPATSPSPTAAATCASTPSPATHRCEPGVRSASGRRPSPGPGRQRAAAGDVPRHHRQRRHRSRGRAGRAGRVPGGDRQRRPQRRAGRWRVVRRAWPVDRYSQ